VSRDQQDMFADPVSRARELKARGRFDEAHKLLQAALEDNPDDLRARASLADLHYRRDEYRRAMGLAGEILRDDPDDPRALVVMGNVLRKKKKPGEALEYFRLALAIAETDYLWLRVAACRLDLKQPNEALAALDTADEFRPDTREGLRLRAAAARLLGNSNMEEKILRMAARKAPREPEAFAAFVIPLLSDLAPRKAALESEKMRAEEGQAMNHSLLLFEAGSLQRGRDPESALELIDLLLSLDPPAATRSRAEQMRESLARVLRPEDGKKK